MAAFEWDEAKRRGNLEKHRIDFLDVAAVFDDPRGYLADSRVVAGELRYLIVGCVDARIVSVVYTRRGKAIRLISARIARRAEREAYGTRS